jgi:nucleotide-binding universal stress UspA family protein
VSVVPEARAELAQVDEEKAEELLAEVSKELGVPGEQTQTIRDGSPPAALLALARDVDAALIVVGSRGLGAVRAALLGSFSTGVLADAPCPVVVVPPAVPGSALG